MFTVVAILVVLLLKRSGKNGTPHGGACSGGGKNGSDIVVISKDSMNKGSDGLSNNSSEMKVEVRTSSSLSNGEDCWEGMYIFFYKTICLYFKMLLQVINRMIKT